MREFYCDFCKEQLKFCGTGSIYYECLQCQALYRTADWERNKLKLYKLKACINSTKYMITFIYIDNFTDIDRIFDNKHYETVIRLNQIVNFTPANINEKLQNILTLQ